jgi:hypothetical protein
MYACIPEIDGGFCEVVCTPSNATADFRDPPQHKRTGAPLLGLRPEVDHAPR